MKKFFEFILVIIIFYGVYSVFTQASYFFQPQPKQLWIIMASLVVSVLLILLYSLMVSSETKKEMKKNIKDLQLEIKDKEEVIAQKENEIKKAQSFKDDLIRESESSEALE